MSVPHTVRPLQQSFNATPKRKCAPTADSQNFRLETAGPSMDISCISSNIDLIMFNFKRYLVGNRRLIDRMLDAAIPSNSVKPAVIHRAMRYAVMSGGKRIRPILCLAASKAVCGKVNSIARHAATAIELLHTYTLIHDDLPSMDNDDFRRGKPTVHKIYGEANAVLAGDALQALAFEVIATGAARRPSTGNLLVRELAIAAGTRGVIGGQVEDLAFSMQPADRNTIKWIHLRKTAMLFIASFRMGGIAGGASARQMDALSVFGCNFGMAFQIIDDILDDIQDSKAPRRRTGGVKTGKQNNLSCIPAYGRTGAVRRAREHLSKACSALRIFSDARSRPFLSLANLIAGQVI
jgi:geranylgeranyl diphosphate synthase type II